MSLRSRPALRLPRPPHGHFGELGNDPANDTGSSSARTTEHVSPDLMLGLSFDGLQVERLLAEGGMGRVYVARVLASGEEVALKVPRTGGDAELLRRFEREIVYARRVTHPNVARVVAAGRLCDGRPYYAMELYRGETLGAAIRGGGPLPLPRAVAITDGVLAGLCALHEAGIVHRDLQPDNVFLARDAERDHVRLIDLGFAEEPDAGSTAVDTIVGTPSFMSPEQTTCSRAITRRSDLFAAALLLYYALSGKLPFRGTSDLQIAIAIVRRAPVPLRRERPELPHAVDELLARALAKHPDARFESARAMRAELSQIA